TGDSSYYYYLPAAQKQPQTGGMFVRMTGDARAVIPSLRSRLQRELPGAAYVTITPFSEVLSGQTRSWSVGGAMFTVFGGLALVLAAIGLYSVIAYNVAQRAHELGVRVALGAQATDVVRLVVSDGLRFGVAGIVIGGGIALAAARWVGPLLFKV